MSHRYSIDLKKVKPATLEKHLMMFTIVSHIMDAQSQPINVLDGDAKGLTFSMRVNLQRQQCERLVIKEIEENLGGYTVKMDWGNKQMRVERATVQGRKKESAGNSGEIAA